jgi:hypothetical protein
MFDSRHACHSLTKPEGKIIIFLKCREDVSPMEIKSQIKVSQADGGSEGNDFGGAFPLKYLPMHVAGKTSR